MKRKQMLLTALLLATMRLSAQDARVVVADASTREPVARASLYAKENGQFRAAISNEQGVARVDFSFHRLTVSHLNYEQQTLRQLPDTIWLQPRYRQTEEVVVTNKEPAWIRQKLRQAAKMKQQNYFTRSDTMAFSYQTESIDKQSLYRYRMAGEMLMRDGQHKLYAVKPDTSIIVASDTTLLTDITNLRRMLSEDFMQELTKSFIDGHRWAEDPDYEGRDRGEVELVFRSKNRTDDRGRLVLDTARCVVLRAYRFTGTETNRHERMPAVLYAMARVLSGYKVEKWTRYYRVSYGERPDGTFFPKQVAYKLYMETLDSETDEATTEFENQIGGGFPNMEATLSIDESRSVPPQASHSAWEELPGTWYLRYGTEESRLREVQLANLPAIFHRY